MVVLLSNSTDSYVSKYQTPPFSAKLQGKPPGYRVGRAQPTL